MPFQATPGADLCSTCRRPLTQRGSDGECLRCLFSLALSPDEDQPAQEGSGLAENHHYGQFEILLADDGSFQELGAGAMGATYRARDGVLHRIVALKVIARSFAGHPDARARFLREARAAARLRHPNVANVFHYGEQDGQCFYAMELVEGETLEERVRRDGPLPPALALEIAVQVARALAAAEAEGIVHRDLKPGNVMTVAGTGQEPVLVKVIDFGLAKAVAAGQPPGLADTRGGFVGTPAFASPEQFSRGENDRIDTRSDIYSLGATLWYLLCGKVPFVGQTLGEIHEQQTRAPLPLEQLKAANVPAPPVAALRSMLAVAPAMRPQSARELLELLTACQARLAPSRRATLRWVAGSVLVGVLLVAALLVALITRRHENPPASPPPDTSVAVLPFENLSPDPTQAFFTQGVHDAVAADLGSVSRIKVIGAASVKSYPAGKPRDLPAIAQALGVAHLLEGSVRRESGQVQVVLKLTDLHDPAANWTARYDRPLAEEFALLGEITHAVAARLHAPPSAEEAAVIDRKQTHDPVAYDLYLRSQEHPKVSRTAVEVRQQCREDIALLDEAVSRDPGFALAYCQLVAKHDNIAMHPPEQGAAEPVADHAALAAAALAQAQRLAPDLGLVHAAAATHYLTTRDYERARLEVDLARRTLPNSTSVETLTGRIARHQDRWNDSVVALERAVALDPRSVNSHAFLEQSYAAVRNYEGADRELAAMQGLLPPGANATMVTGRAFLALAKRADTAPLRAALADITDAVDPDRDIRDNYGLVLALFNHHESRVRYVLAESKMPYLGWGGFTFPRAWFEALAARMRNDDAAARAAFLIARSEAEKYVQAQPDDERSLLLLAMIDAGLGRKEDAVREALRACAMPPKESEMPVGPSDRCCLAVVYAWTDQPDLAFTELQKLSAGIAGANKPDQPTYGDFKLNPLWDPLRKDPRFDALVKLMAPPELH